MLYLGIGAAATVLRCRVTGLSGTSSGRVIVRNRSCELLVCEPRVTVVSAVFSVCFSDQWAQFASLVVLDSEFRSITWSVLTPSLLDCVLASLLLTGVFVALRVALPSSSGLCAKLPARLTVVWRDGASGWVRCTCGLRFSSRTELGACDSAGCNGAVIYALSSTVVFDRCLFER